jgi:cyclic pyranopterin phosphate synthase
MVDVSDKPRVRRTARATGSVILRPQTVALVRQNLVEKGDVLAVARVAGIAAAKRTAELVPLCHNIRIDQVTVDFALAESRIDVEARAICTESTGIEMEALTAVAVAALTIYDMCKAVESEIRITDIHLAEKTKGDPS